MNTLPLLTIPTTLTSSPSTPMPLSTGWVEAFLLMIIWLFVIAVIVGPLVKFFRLEPTSPQLFSDDKKIRSH